MVVFFSTLTAMGQINFEQSDFNTTLAKAAKEGKKVFMDCYTSWCMPCKILDQLVFKTEEAGNFMNANFINFKIDMEKGEGVELCKRYKVTSFPTLLFINPDGSEHNRMIGSTPKPNEFIEKVKVASSKEKGVEYCRKRFETDPSFASTYFEYLTERREMGKVLPLMCESFKLKSPQDRYTKENFALYENAIGDIYSELAGAIFADSKNAISYLGEEKYLDFVTKNVRKTVSNELSMIMGDRHKEASDLDRFWAMTSKYKELNTDMVTFLKEINGAVFEKDLAKTAQQAEKYIGKFNDTDMEMIASTLFSFAIRLENRPPVIPFFKKMAENATDPKLKKKYEGNLSFMVNNTPIPKF